MSTTKTIELIIKDAQAAQSVGDIKKQLKELKNEMLKVGEGSADFNRLARAAGDLKEKMNAANEAVAAFNPDALESVGNFAGKAAAGVSLVTGALSLFGSESKDVEKALLKVQSAMAFAQGIQGIKGLSDAFSNMKTVAVNVFNSIKTAIGGTGIGLIVIAVAALATYWDDIKSAISGVSKEQKKLLEDAKNLSEQAQKRLDATSQEENILRLSGKSEREILQLKKTQTDEVINQMEAELVQQEALRKSQVEAAERNRDILKGILDFIMFPIKALLSSVDLLTEKLHDWGVISDETFNSIGNLSEGFTTSIAEMLFDPAEVEKEGNAAIEATKEKLQELKNARAGYQLSINKIDSDAAETSGKNWAEANKKKEEARQEELDAAIKAAQEEQRLLEEIDARRKANEKKKDEEEEDAFNKWKEARSRELLASKELDVLNAQGDSEKIAAQIAFLEAMRNEELKNKDLTESEKLLIEKKYGQQIDQVKQDFADKDKKRTEDINAFRIDSTKQVLSIVQELFKDNAEAQKATSAAITLIDTWVAAQKAFASQIIVGDPTSLIRGYIAAGLAVVSGLARVAAILKVDTDNPSASGGGGGGGGGNTGSLSVSTQPNVNAATQPTTLLQNQQQQNQPPVYVAVTEINSVNQTVQAMEDRNRF